MLKRFVLAGMASVMMSAAAGAADLPSKDDVELPLPALFAWTGFYAGASGGYGFGMSRRPHIFETVGPAPVLAIAPALIEPEGGFGGGQAGYNQQIGRLILGAEADLQGGRIADSRAVENLPYLGTGQAGLRLRERIDWYGTVRARLGLAFDRVLVYGTGGLAFGGTGMGIGKTDSFGTGAESGLREGTLAGFSAGGGIEYAFYDRWSAKAEYQYVNLGRDRLFVGESNAGGGESPLGITLRDDISFQAVKGGLNYHF